MPLTLHTLDVVVIGRFNPHIITPPWLIAQKVAGVTEVEMRLGFDVDNRRSIVSFEMEGLRWLVNDSRLTISSKTVANDPAKRAALVLDKLPHTPITAIGHNFHYRCDFSSWVGSLPSLGGCNHAALQHYGDPLQVSWSSKIQQAGQVFGINVEQMRSAIEVRTNIHRPVTSALQAIDFCPKFATDLAQSNELIHAITGETVAP
jgi:hypothetical protein